jgi:hypothetical protein
MGEENNGRAFSFLPQRGGGGPKGRRGESLNLIGRRGAAGKKWFTTKNTKSTKDLSRAKCAILLGVLGALVVNFLCAFRLRPAFAEAKHRLRAGRQGSGGQTKSPDPP